MRSLLTLILCGVVTHSVSACTAPLPCSNTSDAFSGSVVEESAGSDSVESAGSEVAKSAGSDIREGAGNQDVNNGVSQGMLTVPESRAEQPVNSVELEVNENILLAQNTSTTGVSRSAAPVEPAPPAANLSSSASNSSINELLALLKGSQQLQARFHQEMRDQRGQLLDQSNGQVRWKKPLSFRWDIEQPFSQSIIVHEGKHYQYDEDLEQLIVRDLSEEVAALPKVILSGDEAAIRENYRLKTIRAVATASSEATGDAQTMFQLEPLGTTSASQSEIVAVLLVFRGAVLTEISVVDSLQQTSRFELSEHVTEGVSATDFELDLPEGIETIYQ